MNQSRLTMAAAAILLMGILLLTRAKSLVVAAPEVLENPSDIQVTGPYDVVGNWPAPLSQLPGHEKWTWGAVDGIFAQNSNRILVAMRGELPILERPKTVAVPQFGPSLVFPIVGVPFRNASSAPLGSPPGYNGSWEGKLGVDARWEHCLFVLNAAGKIVEAWTQWDTLLKSPHRVLINPYDPEKHIWVPDNERNQIYEFTNDGQKLVFTLGEKDVAGEDDKHFSGPTDMTWLPDGTMFVSDGYVNTRVVKFDKNGKYLMAWGQKGNPPNEKRPGFFNSVHAIASDAKRRIYVCDTHNRRIQIFDENGKFLTQWYLGEYASLDSILITADQNVWISAGRTNKLYKFDPTGRMLYSWGTMGDFPGALWGPHGFSVDPNGNLYIAEATNARVQKFKPRKGATPDSLVGLPVRAAWKE
jgi:peptidylamidoglycolate lyase